MDRVDRLMKRAKPKPTLDDKLRKDNSYLGISSWELLEYLSGDNYRAPQMRTWEWEQFMYAMIHPPEDEQIWPGYAELDSA